MGREMASAISIPAGNGDASSENVLKNIYLFLYKKCNKDELLCAVAHKAAWLCKVQKMQYFNIAFQH